MDLSAGVTRFCSIQQKLMVKMTHVHPLLQLQDKK